MFKSKKKKEFLANKKIIEESNLFDNKYYLKHYHDVRVASETPIDHFCKLGLSKNRKPNNDFDPIWYREFYIDIKKDGDFPFVHYINFGNAENRKVNAIENSQYEIIKNSCEFNIEFYRNNYDDLKKQSNNFDFLLHYIRYGASENRKPNSDFDPIWYQEFYKDINEYGDFPFIHYINFGNEENRRVNAIENNQYEIIKNSCEFNIEFYRNNYDDLKQQSDGFDFVLHYVRYGASENRKPNYDFDPNWYQEFYKDINEDGDFPFIHYINFGNEENRRVNAIENNQYEIIKNSCKFNIEFYRNNYDDLKQQSDGFDFVLHYVRYGASENRKPNNDFDTIWYQEFYKDIKEDGDFPFIHYINHGGSNKLFQNRAEEHGSKLLVESNKMKGRETNITKTILSYKEIDMHGKETNLHPKPYYESINYKLDDIPQGPYIVLPYNQCISKKKVSVDVGIHLHLFYYDLLDEFIYFLNNIDFPFSLYVSLVDESIKKSVYQQLSNKLTNAHVVVKVFENRGRDISHFLCGFGQELSMHKIIGHFHSKRSPHNFAKSDWRRQLLVNLLGSKSIVNRIMNYLQENKNIGMFFPTYHYSLKGQISWGTNFKISKKISEKIGIQIDKDNLNLFPAGSMFWAKTESLRPLFSAGFSYHDFPTEKSQVDGTSAHAIERLFGEVVHSSGYDILQVKSSKQHNLINYFPSKYPYIENEKVLNVIKEYQQNKKKNNRIVVFTALTGGYEEAVRHEYLDPNYDYVIFTDAQIETNGFLDVRPMDFWHPDSVRMARRIKTNPHIYLKEYDVTIWIDANVIIKSSISKYVNAFLESKCCIAGIPHPIRNCVYHEAKAILESGREIEHRVSKQIKKYRDESYPEYAGLIETNFMISNLNKPQTKIVMAEWWSEIVQFSHRDQLSINYVLWKENLNWHVLMDEKISLRDNSDFAYLGHGRNSGYIKQDISGIGMKTINPIDIISKAEKEKQVNIPIDIIVCVHNALEEVEQCLVSVKNSIGQNDHIIIVDDASNLDTAGFLEGFKDSNHNVTLLKNVGIAQGYCRAANKGMKASSNEYFLLLNSDTILTRQALKNMLQTAIVDENIGIVGPMSNAASTQSIPDIKNTAKQTAINELPNDLNTEDMNKLCQKWAHPVLEPSVPLVHGFCQLIKKDVYNKIGGFDEKSFPEGYGEENDFCFRAVNAGYDLKICTRAYVFHEKSASYTDADRRARLMKIGSQKLKDKHTEDRLIQSIKMMEGHHLLELMRKKSRKYFEEHGGINEKRV